MVALLLGAALILPDSASAYGSRLPELNPFGGNDYGFSIGGYDPRDPQFDAHASLAFPVGIRTRLRVWEWVCVEAEGAYFRAGGQGHPALPVSALPRLDGLLVRFMLEAAPRSRGPVRPYAGVGPVFLSLSRDFVVELPEVPEENAIARFQLGKWTRFDLGWAACAGMDFRMGRRLCPYVEARYLFGSLTVEEVLFGLWSRSPESLGLSNTYDYSGPMVSAGLRIPF
ncbi:MAG: hypothetical protein CME07_00685 [Gemmatimonadetes bacterium]|jgi:hypothetical protein|nr:hypothetical protein [Gemmatimonadota bacterium]